VKLSQFSEFADPIKEANDYLTCWAICRKEELNKTLTKDERSIHAAIGAETCECAGKSLEKYLESRRSTIGSGSNNADSIANVGDSPSVETPVAVEEPPHNTLPAINYEQFSLEIPDLDEAGFSTVLFGSSKSGKTTLMKKILQMPELADPDLIKILISPSMQARIYKDIDKRIIRMEKWDDRLVKGIQKVQKKTKNKYKYLLIIDDCILEKNSGKIMECFCTLRNVKVSTLMLLQSTTLLNRNSRFNANNIIFKKMNVDDATEQNMQWFLGSYAPFKGLTMDDKKALYREITNDYGFVNLDALNGTLQCCKD
jgi:hypothetical protein